MRRHPALVSRGRGEGDGCTKTHPPEAGPAALSGRRRCDEDGFSLIDVLVTLVIMTIGVVALIGGLISTIALTDYHRKDATTQTVLRNYAETLKAEVLQSCPQGYSPGQHFTNAFPSQLPIELPGYSVSTSPALGATPPCPNPITTLTLTASHLTDSAGNPSVQVSASVQITLASP